MSSAAESAFIVGYARAEVSGEDLSPWFLALPVLLYHAPTHAFTMTIALLGVVAAYEKLPAAVRSSDRFALATSAISTVATFSVSALQVAADLTTVD
tara:strand:- start:566 stop:856 length:291 start_codon:yes stop_codon:yes gene_type:complete